MDIQHSEVSCSELNSTSTMHVQSATLRGKGNCTKHAHLASQLSTFDCRLDANAHSKCPWCGDLICELTAENMWARAIQSISLNFTTAAPYPYPLLLPT